METGAPASRGLFASIQGLGSGLIATVHDRVELLALELHEEKFRLIQIYIWISAATFFGMMTLAFGSVTLVYLFPESERGKVLAGLTGFYALAVMLIVVAFRRYLARQPKPFAGTINELKEDMRVSSSRAE